MTEPGAPTSAPPPLAAVTAASRDRLGCRRRLCRRPRRLRTPERASAPPHNRTAPRGASRHARARGRRAPAAPPPPRPSLIYRLGRGRACAPRKAGERESERLRSSGPFGIQGRGETGGGGRRPTGVRAPGARAHEGVREPSAATVPGQRPLPARGSHALSPVALAAPPPSCHLRPAPGHMRLGRWDARFPGRRGPAGETEAREPDWERLLVTVAPLAFQAQPLGSLGRQDRAGSACLADRGAALSAPRAPPRPSLGRVLASRRPRKRLLGLVSVFSFSCCVLPWTFLQLREGVFCRANKNPQLYTKRFHFSNEEQSPRNLTRLRVAFYTRICI